MYYIFVHFFFDFLEMVILKSLWQLMLMISVFLDCCNCPSSYHRYCCIIISVANLTIIILCTHAQFICLSIEQLSCNVPTIIIIIPVTALLVFNNLLVATAAHASVCIECAYCACSVYDCYVV